MGYEGFDCISKAPFDSIQLVIIAYAILLTKSNYLSKPLLINTLFFTTPLLLGGEEERSKVNHPFRCTSNEAVLES